MPSVAKCSVIRCFRNQARCRRAWRCPRRRSEWPLLSIRSCPAPSATTITACPRCSRRRRRTLQEAAFAFQPEGDFGDEHEVGVAHGQRGVAGDEAGVAAHELDQAHAVGRALASTWTARMLSAASEKAVWKPKLWSMNMMSLSIVLGMPTTAIFAPALGDFLGDAHGAAERAVAADDEQHVDAHPFQAIDDLGRDPARRARCRGSCRRVR